MASNLPPGVSLNMIPGNRPEDEAYEVFWEELFKLNPNIPDEFADADWFVKAVDTAKEMGYNEGRNDTLMEIEIDRAMKHDDDTRTES